MNIRRSVKFAIENNDFDLMLSAYQEDSSQVLRNLQLHVFSPATNIIRWKAIEFLGELAHIYAKYEDLTYRNIIRRFIWQMCEEGANVPWASPEVVCSILSETGDQYNEFIGPVFFHASMNEINYAGMFWGMTKLGKEKLPLFQEKLDEKFFQRLVYNDSYVRAYGAWAMSKLPCKEAVPYLQELLNDYSDVLIYENDLMASHTISELAEKALQAIES